MSAVLAWPLTPERQTIVLRQAHTRLALGKRCYKDIPLWSFISEMTTHGSGYSAEICRLNGWNASQDASLPLAPVTKEPAALALPLAQLETLRREELETLAENS